jgi:O-antigen ligase
VRALHGVHALLILSFLILLPSKTLFNVSMLALAAAGLAVLGTVRRDVWLRGHVKQICVVFALLWVPMLVSVLTAVDPLHALESVVIYPRFLLATIFILYALRNAVVRRWVALGAFALGVFWALDALFQFVVGFDVLGYPFVSGQLRGIFYPKYRLGMSLAMLVPLLLDVIFRQRIVHRGWALVLPVVVVVIGLTLHRNAWLMLCLSLSAYLVFVVFTVRWRPRMPAIVAGGVIMGIALGFVSTQESFKGRLLSSLNAVVEDEAQFEAQLGQRPDIWRTAVSMFRDNAITGVGPRSFNEAYETYADEDDYWLALNPPQVPSHPHQTGLEIAAESGLLGLVGAFFAFVFVFWLWRASGPGRLAAAPWLIAAAVVASPTNISKAFYGSVTSSLIWWFLAVGLAMAWCGRDGETEADMS